MIDLFEKQVEQTEYWCEDTKEWLLKMRNGYTDGSLTEGELNKLANNMLKRMFETPYHYLIPAEFLDTQVGRFLIKFKYLEQREAMLSTGAVALISGKGRNMINKEIRANKLAAKSIMGRYEIREADLIEYVLKDKKKNLSEEEIIEKIEEYKKLRDSGRTEKEIEKMWRDQ